MSTCEPEETDVHHAEDATLFVRWTAVSVYAHYTFIVEELTHSDARHPDLVLYMVVLHLCAVLDVV